MTNYIISAAPPGRLYELTDKDLWGLVSALEHGIRDGYLWENVDWAMAMVDRLQTLRGHREEQSA